MNTSQVQIRVSVSAQLGELLKAKAERLGLPITQFVKHLIVKEVEEEQYPTYEMSEATEKAVEKAMEDYKNGKSIRVDDMSEYLKNL